jgi:hypothetical protein
MRESIFQGDTLRKIAMKRGEVIPGFDPKGRKANHRPRCPHCLGVVNVALVREGHGLNRKLVKIGYWCKQCEVFLRE